MLDFQQKRKLRKTAYSKVTFLVLFVLVVLLGHATWNVYQKYAEAKASEDRVSQNLAELKEREISLSADIERLNTERGVEEEVRKRFGAVKEGEQVVVIVDPEGAEELLKQGAEREYNWWQKFLRVFQ